MIALALLLAKTAFQIPSQPEFTPESSRFGMLVSGVGDQNGDGTPELFVGEDEMTYLDGWVLSGQDGSTLLSFRCAWETGSLADVVAAPDVDGDGKQDLLVCALPYDALKPADLRLLSLGSAELLWRAKLPRSYPGHCIRLVHDADGDGLDDFGFLRRAEDVGQLELTILSAKDGEVAQTLTCTAAREKGRCGFLECSDLDGDGKRDVAFVEEGEPRDPSVLRAWSSAHKKSLWKIEQPGRWTSISGALATPGDVNGDGVADLAVTFGDEVYAVSGKTGETLYRLWTLSANDSFAGFGACVLPLGDANGDGICDIVLSESDEFLSPSVRAFSGKDGMQLWLKSPPIESGVYHFGRGLALVGDIDGDGVSELIAGSWEGAAGQPGYAALLSGKRGTPMLEFRRGPAGVVARRPDPKRFWLPPK